MPNKVVKKKKKKELTMMMLRIRGFNNFSLKMIPQEPVGSNKSSIIGLLEYKVKSF